MQKDPEKSRLCFLQEFLPVGSEYLRLKNHKNKYMYLEVLWLSEDVNGLVVLDGGHPPLFLAARLNHHRTIHINLKYNLFNFILLVFGISFILISWKNGSGSCSRYELKLFFRLKKYYFIT